MSNLEQRVGYTFSHNGRTHTIHTSIEALQRDPTGYLKAQRDAHAAFYEAFSSEAEAAQQKTTELIDAEMEIERGSRFAPEYLARFGIKTVLFLQGLREGTLKPSSLLKKKKEKTEWAKEEAGRMQATALEHQKFYKSIIDTIPDTSRSDAEEIIISTRETADLARSMSDSMQRRINSYRRMQERLYGSTSP